MSFSPDPCKIFLDSSGKVATVGIKRRGFDPYSVTPTNAQGTPTPPTGLPFSVANLRRSGSYLAADLQFSFAGLSTAEGDAWRLAFASGSTVVISLDIASVAGGREDLRVQLGTVTVVAALRRVGDAAASVIKDSAEFVLALGGLFRALVGGIVGLFTPKGHVEESLVHAEVPKRLE